MQTIRSHAGRVSKLAAIALGAAVGTAALAAPRPPPPTQNLCPLPGQTGTCTMPTAAAGTGGSPLAPLLPVSQPKFQNELPQPIFFVPDKGTFPSFDYYEVAAQRAGKTLAYPVAPFGSTPLTDAVLKPDTFEPLANNGGMVPKVWLGLVNPAATTQKLYTEVWGYAQTNTTTGNFALANVATYPAMSFRATRGTPVKVKWWNNLPDQHLFCKQPQNSDVPCAIDRTLMGTLLRIPATGYPNGADTVGPYGGPQQPDNAMVVHLHGGEIPPDSDGFAELWFGSSATAAAYRPPATTNVSGVQQNVDPQFLAPAGHAILSPNPSAPAGTYNGNGTTAGDPFASASSIGSLVRPTGNAMIYNYPMVQDAATIWYHDHALGKTRVNVAAGPAGYFYIQDPAVDTALWGNTPDGAATANQYAFGTCTNAGILAGACRDVPIVFQDRSFNADGSINFPNGLGQVALAGLNPLTPGVNPTIHPQWVPEYFGDMAVVNGITWPRMTVQPMAYRLRLLDGSNARCWTFSTTTASGRAGPPFQIIASDQGYLPIPVTAATLTMCPGERYEVVVDFSAFPGQVITLTNTAGAPYPAGPTPQKGGSPYAQLASVMQFSVANVAPSLPWTPPANWKTAVASTVVAEGKSLGFSYGPTGAQAVPSLVAVQAVAAAQGGPAAPVFQVLNEVLDPVTAQPLRVQINGTPFEGAVTDAPKRGTTQVWQIINTTVDAHPMHLHLVKFKVVQRQAFNVSRYKRANVVGFPPVVTQADPTPYLLGSPRGPDLGEEGFKDTARALPGEVLTLVARWDGAWADCPTGSTLSSTCKIPAASATAPYFQPVTAGPYVWHCHIVDHEDNEMMRPVVVVP